MRRTKALGLWGVVWLLGSCRAVSGNDGTTKELEDSLAICSDLQDLSRQDATVGGVPFEVAFRMAKAREGRILMDLIARANPDERPVYERQKVRLEACVPAPQSATEEAAAAARNEEKRRVFLEEIQHVQSLSSLCRVAAGTVLGSPKTDACRTQILMSSCQQLGATPPGTLQQALLVNYREALTACIQSLAGDDAAMAAETFATEFQREVDSGADQTTALLIAGCRSGAKLLGDSTANIPAVDYENACGALGSADRYKSRGRIAACLRTAVDICEVFISKDGMRLDDLVPAQGGALDQLLRELYQGVDTAVCAKNGTTHLACRVIGESAAQIKQAIMAGNNDWASCVGTDQLGACLGTLWATGGFTNNNGVATAEQSGQLTYRPCCACQKDYYADDGWFSDTRYRQENWFGVIQAGDVATGNCKRMEGGTHPGDKEPTYNGSKTYYKYAQCDRRYVKGDSCAAPQGVHQVWDSPTQKWIQVTVP